MGPVGEFTDLMSKDNPTDMGHFGDVVNDRLQQFIGLYGKCRPKRSFPKDEIQENRSFSGAYYNMVSKAGLSVEVSWLAYSPIFDSAYCEPCWLFADRTDPHSITVRGLQACKHGNKCLKKSKSTHLQRHTFSRVWFLSKGRDTEQLQIWQIIRHRPRKPSGQKY